MHRYSLKKPGRSTSDRIVTCLTIESHKIDTKCIQYMSCNHLKDYYGSDELRVMYRGTNFTVFGIQYAHCRQADDRGSHHNIMQSMFQQIF